MFLPSPAQPVRILALHASETGSVEQVAELVAEGAREIQGVEGKVTMIEGEGDSRTTPVDDLRADGVAVRTTEHPRLKSVQRRPPHG